MRRLIRVSVCPRPSVRPVQNIEARLKVSLPTDLGAALTDGVVLCHLANHVRPRSVPSIHVPSPAVVSVVPASCWSSRSHQCDGSSSLLQPKLTMAKCRRNVENFLEACRRMGVPQVSRPWGRGADGGWR